MLGDIDNALLAYERSLQLKPSRLAYTNLGTSYYYAGKFKDSAEMQKLALQYAPDDHRIWGRLAESYRFVEGQASNAIDAYEKAATFAKAKLTVNDKDWLTSARLGLYNMYLSDFSEGQELLTEAVDASQRNPEILYLQALAELYVGEHEEAISLLEEALEKEPFFKQFIILDPDLQGLSDNQRFIDLLSK